MPPVSFFTFYEKTAFIPLRFIYPECEVLINEHPNVYPLQCFKTSCPANKNCTEAIAKRVHFLFDNVLPKEVQLILAYFKYRDKPESVRACTFWNDFGNTKIITMNRSGFAKCKSEGIVYQWDPEPQYWLIGNSNKIIPVETLINGRRIS